MLKPSNKQIDNLTNRQLNAEATIVVFRKYADGSIIALFPADAATVEGYHCMSYVHVGQHGAADYNLVVNQSKPATPAEYAALETELKLIGYNLEIRKKVQYKIHRQRIDSVRAQQ